MPNMMDILRTVMGKGHTRRDVLKGAAEQFMPEQNIHQEWDTASAFFNEHPDLWKPEWGPIEEAEPEDLVSALEFVMSELRG